MAYSKQTWENLPNQTTPITAERLNHMEDGIYEAYEHGGGGETLPVGSEIDFDGTSADIPTGWEETTDPESYSTDEVKTNKTWVNGKPIYRKVLVIPKSSIPGTGNRDYAHGINNVDEWTEVTGKVYRSTGVANPIPWSTTSTWATIFNDFTGTNIGISLGSDIYNNATSMKIILEYTKTTD